MCSSDLSRAMFAQGHTAPALLPDTLPLHEAAQ